MKKCTAILVAGIAGVIFASNANAAITIDLAKQPSTELHKLLATSRQVAPGNGNQMKRLSERVDFNQTQHTRMQQYFNGVPVWGADVVAHQKSAKKRLVSGESALSMNGVIYRDLAKDLADTVTVAKSKAQQQKAIKLAIDHFADSQQAAFTAKEPTATIKVYVDQANKAHWIYEVRYSTSRIHGMPAKPVYLIDAVTLDIYKQWNDIKTKRTIVSGGGVGGNPNTGKFSYDGLQGHKPELAIERDAKNKRCYLRNNTVIVKNVLDNNRVPSFPCKETDSKHNNVYWNTTDDARNGGYSPNNDGLFSDMITRRMYKEWFGLDMLVKNGKPMKVTFYVHDPELKQNAYYDNGMMAFGEGDAESYPLAAPSVVAHEMTHGFTEQRSGLIYSGQSGGLNEAFSDMADKSVEYFEYGKNNWGIDTELLKPGGRMLRWMDEPTKDCNGGEPGNWCSISHMKDYFQGLDVHFSSGIFNKAFYLIATKWNTKKAFEVMTQANVNYWTSNTSFEDAACGVIKATQDYKYDTKVVHDAFAVVGIDSRKHCK